MNTSMALFIASCFSFSGAMILFTQQYQIKIENGPVTHLSVINVHTLVLYTQLTRCHVRNNTCYIVHRYDFCWVPWLPIHFSNTANANKICQYLSKVISKSRRQDYSRRKWYVVLRVIGFKFGKKIKKKILYSILYH